MAGTKQTQREPGLIGRMKDRPMTEEAGAELSVREAVLPSKLRDWRAKLSAKAKQEKRYRFYSLYGLVSHPETLRAAWTQVRANGGKPGVDGITIEQIEKEGEEAFLEKLACELKEKTYRTGAVRRVYIPKANGKRRPLGIPNLRDRVVQTAALLILEPIFESDFLDCSYGFRPGRSAHDALGLQLPAGPQSLRRRQTALLEHAPLQEVAGARARETEGDDQQAPLSPATARDDCADQPPPQRMGQLLPTGIQPVRVPTNQPLRAGTSGPVSAPPQPAGVASRGRHLCLCSHRKARAHFPVNASHDNVLRKPDAGNPHVRFDEGEGSRRSSDLSFHSVTSFSTLLNSLPAPVCSAEIQRSLDAAPPRYGFA